MGGKMIPTLEHGSMYHVYNRGNNREKLFREKRNYDYFLKLYLKYVDPIAVTYAYCLMPNHFHSLVKIREQKVEGLSPKQQYSNFFNSYAKSINKAYGRVGALFQRPFGRIEVTDDSYRIQLVFYVHLNPQRHGLVKDFRNYKYSSYKLLLQDDPTFLARTDVMAWFGGPDGFVEAHDRSQLGSGSFEAVGED
jgi:putative transposase